MKQLKIFIYISLFTMVACENDEALVMINSDATPPGISVPASDTDIVITGDNIGSEADFEWTKTGYGVNTEVTYTLEIDAACNAFANPIVVGVTSANTLSLSMADLNSKLIEGLGIAPYQKSELQLRVSSVINGNFQSVSDIVPISVTPWSDKPIALWMGENSKTVPVLYATSGTTYEGYRYLTAGTNFRFSNSPLCADVVYGSESAGTLTLGETASPINVVASGYYKINADTDNLTYEMTPVDTWGMIGTATPNGWDSSTPMAYNPDKDVWQAELALTSGALKFRANDGWDINYGPAAINDLVGSLVQTNDAIDIAEPGNYIVIIDFSQSKAPYNYVYTVAKAGEIAEPAKLWLPGSYQGWSPATAPVIYAINDFTYEGYVYINASAGFKFTSAPDWDHINYGDSGTPGLLTTDGSKDGLSLASAGYYKFKVNTNTLAYTIDLINTWGLVGTSTTGGWDISTPMTYDQANDVWKITTDLVSGALKFRANDGWDINYGVGDINALEGTLVFDAASINIAEAGNYTITLDFSRSASPYQFTYSVKKN